jgi:tetratricopeptide (TPR) repeat protein
VLRVEELLERFSDTTSLIEAERLLESIALFSYPPDLPLGDLYDGLAEAAAEAGDYGRAIRAQQRALALGCQWPELGREMLGWYLLKDGRIDEGEALFDLLKRQRPGDALLLLTLAAARRDAGLHTAALAAYDEALATAIASDAEMVDQARVERRHCREELGLELDADDLLAPDRVQPRSAQVAVALRWFPREQHAFAAGPSRRRVARRRPRFSRARRTGASAMDARCVQPVDCATGRRRLAHLRRGST